MGNMSVNGLVGIGAYEVHAKNGCGVYFLCDGDRVVYVGQSKNMVQRLGSHANKDFNRALFMPVDERDLDRVESLFIALLRPGLNGLNKDGTMCAPIRVSEVVALAPDQRKSAARHESVTQDDNRCLRMQKAADFLGISLPTLWRWIKERPDFPRPIRLSANCTVIDQAELFAWRDGLREQRADKQTKEFA